MNRGLALALMLSLTACFEPPAEAPADTSVLIGVQGGRVLGEAISLELPPGAVATDTLIRVTRLASVTGAPGRAVGPAFLLQPEGLQFAKPVRLTLSLSDGSAPRVFIATAPKDSTSFTLLNATHTTASATTAISHFSYFVPVVVEPDGGTNDAGTSGADAGWSLPLDAGVSGCKGLDGGSGCAGSGSRTCAEVQIVGCAPYATALAVNETHLVWGDIDGPMWIRNKQSGEARMLPDAGVASITLRDGHAYWSSQNTLRRTALAGGGTEILAITPTTPQDLAVDATHVYWVDQFGGKIYRAPVAGGSSELVLSGESAPRGLVLDDSNLYWSAYNSGQIRKRALGGGSATTLFAGTPLPWMLALNGGFIYWSEDNAPGSLRRGLVSGGTISVLASNQDVPRHFATDGTTLFWAGQGGNFGTPGLYSLNLSGGAPDRLLSVTNVGLVAMDATDYYFATRAIMRLPR